MSKCQWYLFLLPLGLALVRAPGNKNFIAAKAYKQAEGNEALSLLDGLRVADVTDGLDVVGLQDVRWMDSAIRPLWRDSDKFDHPFAGIAVPARHVPTHRRAGKMANQ